jgi:hypothetical protein
MSDEHQSGTEAPAEPPGKLVGGGPQGSNEVIGDPGQEQHPVPDEPEVEDE